MHTPALRHRVVNLKRDVFDVLFEAQQFEHLGFTLPAVLRTAIMKKDLLFKDYERMTEVVDRYRAIINNLSMSEVIFLRGHIYDTELFIQMGIGRYTWTSFNISKFCDQINSQGTLLMCIAIKSGLRVLFTQRRELHNLAGGFWYGLLWFPKGQQYSGIAIRLLHVASVADR